MPKTKKSNKQKSIKDLTKNFDKFDSKEVTKEEFDQLVKKAISGKRKKSKS